MKKITTLFIFLSLLLAVLAQTKHPIRILYFNDAHELNPVQTPAGYIGGVSRMKTLIDSVKKENPHALVLFGGDLAGGTLGGKMFKGSVMVESLNTFPVDYANFGQHEFDYGIDNTRKLIQASRFKWFTSNVVLTNGNPIPLSHPHIVHTWGKKRIGIIGLTDKINTSKPTSGVKQTDIMTAARNTIKNMGAVDYLIAVTQMDMNLNEALLTTCPQINLVLTEETSQHKTEVQFINNSLIIVGCGNMGQLVDVAVDDNKKARITTHAVDQSVPQNDSLRTYAHLKTQAAEAHLNQVLAHATAEGNADFTGTIVADAYRAHYRVQAAIINGGGIRARFPHGDITTKHVYAVVPFENTVIPVRLSGSQIKELLIRSAKQPAQVSGLSYQLKTGVKPQLANVYMDGKPINDSTIYTVAMPDFIVLGGGDFDAIPTPQWINFADGYQTDADIVVNYLKKNPNLTFASPPKRIVLLESK